MHTWRAHSCTALQEPSTLAGAWSLLRHCRRAGTPAPEAGGGMPWHSPAGRHAVRRPALGRQAGRRSPPRPPSSAAAWQRWWQPTARHCLRCAAARTPTACGLLPRSAHMLSGSCCVLGRTVTLPRCSPASRCSCCLTACCREEVCRRRVRLSWGCSGLQRSCASAALAEMADQPNPDAPPPTAAGEHGYRAGYLLHLCEEHAAASLCGQPRLAAGGGAPRAAGMR